MFAVHSHSQVVYHLSQLASAVSYRRSSTVPSKRNVTTCEAVPSSFLEIRKQLNLDKIPVSKNLDTSIRFIFFRKKSPTKFMTSYVSSFSFEANRRGIEDNICQQHAPVHNGALNRMFFTSFCTGLSVRTFKTYRTAKIETLRSPSLSLRLKKLLGSDKQNPFERDPLPYGHEILKQAEHMSEEESRKMKLAFAEGYIAGQNKAPNKALRLVKALQNFLIVSLLIGGVALLLASASGTVFKLQLSSQAEVDAQDIDITFDDVKGVDEAKQELQEIVEFLKNPEKFSVLGGKLPKGVLLVGPPGTGKTLLARAVAGEAGVPFFHAAGSEFDEILVGQGARRVRDLFNAAKNKAPCVIFIDEIDAVGGKRTNSVLHPYANQTINQLLSEMDGFHQNEGVIVLGATNRREDLDKALLRPGRFDVEVHVSVPDLAGRKDILNLYLSKIKCQDIDVDLLARGTTGFTGADLENMVNLSALRAAIDGSKFVTMKDLENARDKVLMGPERKSRIPDEEANEITAYHEGGHTLVAFFTKDSHPIHKVTIIPRGPSLGHTAYIPKKENYHTRKSELLASMDTMMGGRAAEEIIFGSDKITSGAASDLKQATAIATHMVKEWGMSEKAGLRTYDTSDGALISVNELSSSTTEAIDSEIKKLLQESYERAKAIIRAHPKELKQLAEALLKYETLEADDVKAIMNSKGAEKSVL